MCQVRHTGVFVTGRMRVRHDDGTEESYGPGDVLVDTAGTDDAWVDGEEVCVLVDTGIAPSSRRLHSHFDHMVSSSPDCCAGNREAGARGGSRSHRADKSRRAVAGALEGRFGYDRVPPCGTIGHGRLLRPTRMRQHVLRQLCP